MRYKLIKVVSFRMKELNGITFKKMELSAPFGIFQ